MKEGRVGMRRAWRASAQPWRDGERGPGPCLGLSGADGSNAALDSKRQLLLADGARDVARVACASVVARLETADVGVRCRVVSEPRVEAAAGLLSAELAALLPGGEGGREEEEREKIKWWNDDERETGMLKDCLSQAKASTSVGEERRRIQESHRHLGTADVLHLIQVVAFVVNVGLCGAGAAGAVLLGCCRCI